MSRWQVTLRGKQRNPVGVAAIAEKLDVSISSIKRARTIKATGATAVLEYEPAPAAAFAMLHRIYARAQDKEGFWPPFGPENDQAVQGGLGFKPATLRQWRHRR